MQELCDSHIVGALIEELGHSDIVGLKELRHSCVEVVGQINSMLVMVGGKDFIEELSDGDVVVGEVLCHSNAILSLKELGYSDVVRVEEL